MKKLILIFIMIGIYSLCQAKPWYDYDVYTNPADGDHFLINDISETGPPDNNAEGTLKRLAWLYVQPRDSDLTSLAAIAFSANMLSFLDAADYAEMRSLMAVLALAGGTLTGSVVLDDETTDSPYLRFIDETNEYFNMYKVDGSHIYFSTDTGTDRNLSMANIGVGNLNLLIDGTISEGGSLLSALYQALHANLTAIADAETGVVSPGITMYDDNGTGTGTAFIYGTTVDDNKDVVMSIGVEEEGSETPAVYIELDGINERVDVLKPLNAGIDIAIKSASYNIETTESDVCRKVYYRYGGSGQDTFTLPALTQCNSISGYGKEFYFLNYDSGEGEDIWIEPAGTDKIWLNGVSCTAGLGVQCTTDQGDRLHIFGSSETNWTVQDYTGTCACETP